MDDNPLACKTLSDTEDEIIALFKDGVRVVGLPKSLGEIYGLLFLSLVPLTMSDLTKRLGISKGSASQGLKMLKTLGAVQELEFNNDRKTYYQANVELKKLVGGFVAQEVIPHLSSGRKKIAEIEKKISNIENDKPRQQHYKKRISRLKRWSNKTQIVLPLLQRLLRE